MSNETSQQSGNPSLPLRVFIYFVLLLIVSQFNTGGMGWFLNYGENAWRVAFMNMAYNGAPWAFAYALTWMQVVRRQRFFVRALVLLGFYAGMVAIQNFEYG